MNKWQKFWGHLRTVQKHRKMVRKLCFKCGLYWQGLTHDLSKYSWVEFWNGVKYYTGTTSPHVAERKRKGYSAAWIHHHNKNKHHAEYWVDIVNGESSPICMPFKYLTEMICDRVAASMVYLGDNFKNDSPLVYYTQHYGENELHDTTRKMLEYWLLLLAKGDINNTFYLIKKHLKAIKGSIQK